MCSLPSRGHGNGLSEKVRRLELSGAQLCSGLACYKAFQFYAASVRCLAVAAHTVEQMERKISVEHVSMSERT